MIAKKLSALIAAAALVVSPVAFGQAEAGAGAAGAASGALAGIGVADAVGLAMAAAVVVSAVTDSKSTPATNTN